MTTYVYETINPKPGEKPQYFEIKQGMNEPPLSRHPETGEAIRRVVLGGFGVLSSKAPADGSGSSCGCAPGGCCG
jgi:predicted nucleic acid-binding Zn ribbon protein